MFKDHTKTCTSIQNHFAFTELYVIFQLVYYRGVMLVMHLWERLSGLQPTTHTHTDLLTCGRVLVILFENVSFFV